MLARLQDQRVHKGGEMLGKGEHLGWSGRLRPAIAIEKKLCGKDKWKENFKCPFIQSIKKKKSGVSK